MQGMIGSHFISWYILCFRDPDNKGDFWVIVNKRKGGFAMLLEYVHAALHRAKYDILPEDGSYYGEIPECNGVYANAKSLEDCREELREVLEEWVLFRVHKNLPLPVIDGIELLVKEIV